MNENLPTDAECKFLQEFQRTVETSYWVDAPTLLLLRTYVAAEVAKATGELLKEKLRVDEIANRLLAHMDDGTHQEGGECSVCAAICCPHGEPFHFHHDGCPACCEPNTHSQ